ncbi:GNAT family N-acetyltransferase [Streptomyces sp. NPDC001970]
MTASASVTRRAYEGPDDLRAMQELTSRTWSAASTYHVGDLAWGRFMFPPERADWPGALWEAAGGRVVAWGWAHFPDDLRMEVDPAHPELIDEVLDWFDAHDPGGPREIVVLDARTRLRAALTARGYRQQTDDEPHFAHHIRPLAGLPAVPALPAGFTARAVRGVGGEADEDELERRVAVHRAAWNSTGVTVGSYRAVRASWPYRPELDRVVEAPDGSFAASCLIWYDDTHRTGLVEPVGTAPGFRRRGLSRAVCLAALHALRDAGARDAVVCPRGDAGYPVPRMLYRSLGFRQYARTYTYSR